MTVDHLRGGGTAAWAAGSRRACGLRVICFGLKAVCKGKVVLPFAGTWKGSSAMIRAIEGSCGPHVVALGSMARCRNARPAPPLMEGPAWGASWALHAVASSARQ